MKQFVFRLQVVLDRACEEEEAELRALGELQQARLVLERRIEETKMERKALCVLMSDMQHNAFDAWSMQQCHMQLQAFAERLAYGRHELTEMQRRIARQQEVVTQAIRKRKSLEMLRERHLAAYKHEVNRQELRQMEEAVLPRLAREQAEQRARERLEAVAPPASSPVFLPPRCV